MKMPESLELLLYDALDADDSNAIRELMIENPGLGLMEIPGGHSILTSTFEHNHEIGLMLINDFPDSIDFIASEGQHEGQSTFERALFYGANTLAEKMVDTSAECIQKHFISDIINHTNIIEFAEASKATYVIEKLYERCSAPRLNRST